MAFSSAGFSCCVQWPQPRIITISRSGTSSRIASARSGRRAASYSAVTINERTGIRAAAISGVVSQFRSRLRYQLIPPVNPVRAKAST